MREFAVSFVDKAALSFTFWLAPEEKQGYDHLEVWRSTTLEGGIYEELTGQSWGPASLTAKRGIGALVGTTLALLIGETAVSITFTGVDPLDLTAVSGQISAACAGLASASVDALGSSLTITTTNVGCAARLEITGGDAAPMLGFSVYTPTNRAYGTNARLLLTKAQQYAFQDVWGKAPYFYKTRFRRVYDGAVSEFSPPMMGNVNRAVTPEQLVVGWLRMVDFQGRPVANRSIMVSTQDTVQSLSLNGLVVDFSAQVLATDAQGYCSLLLLRGVRVTVGIAGTALVRDIIPPTDTDVHAFNLFDPTIGTDDAFTVQVPLINIAPRQDC